MVNTPCDGSGWWAVDLGGVYNLKQIIFWNRYPFVSANTTQGWAMGQSAVGATIKYLNYFGNSVGSYVLGNPTSAGQGNPDMMIVSIPVVLTPFSPSPASTVSTTPAATGTASTSATISSGATPSQTNTMTPTSSQTPSNTPSSSQSPTSAPTPYSPYPNRVQIGTTATNVLNFVEVSAAPRPSALERHNYTQTPDHVAPPPPPVLHCRCSPSRIRVRTSLLPCLGRRRR